LQYAWSGALSASAGPAISKKTQKPKRHVAAMKDRIGASQSETSKVLNALSGSPKMTNLGKLSQ
jgi:hypothetical protein